MAAKDNGVIRVDLPGEAWWDIRVEGITWDEIKKSKLSFLSGILQASPTMHLVYSISVVTRFMRVSDASRAQIVLLSKNPPRVNALRREPSPQPNSAHRCHSAVRSKSSNSGEISCV